jgi:hypothetical protein
MAWQISWLSVAKRSKLSTESSELFQIVSEMKLEISTRFPLMDSKKSLLSNFLNVIMLTLMLKLMYGQTCAYFYKYKTKISLRLRSRKIQKRPSFQLRSDFLREKNGRKSFVDFIRTIQHFFLINEQRNFPSLTF